MYRKAIAISQFGNLAIAARIYYQSAIAPLRKLLRLPMADLLLSFGDNIVDI